MLPSPCHPDTFSACCQRSSPDCRLKQAHGAPGDGLAASPGDGDGFHQGTALRRDRLKASVSGVVEDLCITNGYFGFPKLPPVSGYILPLKDLLIKQNICCVGWDPASETMPAQTWAYI